MPNPGTVFIPPIDQTIYNRDQIDRILSSVIESIDRKVQAIPPRPPTPSEPYK